MKKREMKANDKDNELELPLFDMAREHYNRCLQVDPNFDKAKQALIRIQ